MSENREITDGPDLLSARATGDTIPAMKAAALDTARELYGPGADLRIEGMSLVSTNTLSPDRGKFWAWVYVRCLSDLSNVPGPRLEPPEE